jgi:hypothetical protein
LAALREVHEGGFSMKNHSYTLKVGIQHSSNVFIETSAPVVKDAIVTRLLDGKRYVAMSIYPAKHSDRAVSAMPETVLHLWPMGSLSDDELQLLREKAKYTPREYEREWDDFVFTKSAQVLG